MTTLAEGTRDGGTRWTSVYAIFPNVTVTSKAAIAAGIISHGNGGLGRLEGMEVVTSTRRKGECRPLIVFKNRKGFPFMEQPCSHPLALASTQISESSIYLYGLLV